MCIHIAYSRGIIVSYHYFYIGNTQQVDGNLVPDYSGIRPKLLHPDVATLDKNQIIRDFMIAGPEYHGVKGLIVLLGIESPG